MSQTVSNHEKNRVESWVKLGQIMSPGMIFSKYIE